MAVENGLSTNLGTALSIDVAQRFNQQFNSLRELLGIENVQSVASGTLIKTYQRAEVDLADGNVAPGEVIPLSEVSLVEGPTQELVWDKRRKAVTMEDIQAYGFEGAIVRTDNALIREVQKGVRTKLLDQLATGTGATSGENLQQVMAQNWAAVTTAFDEDDVQVISFINPFDAADYLGDAAISTQNAFGMNYVQDFLNNRVIFMHGEVPQGTVYSTADQNLNAVHVNMAGGEVNRAFDFTTDDTGLIGVTHDINKQRLQAETITAYGLALFAEVIDGVVVGTIEPAPEV